jgi:lysozyme
MFTPTNPKPGTVWGCDVSFYQDNNETPQKIDFAKMRANGASFVIIRAGQNRWTDPDFVDNWKNAKGILPRGAYFYLDSRVSIRGQAKLFADLLRFDPGELPWTVDFEQIAQVKYGIPQLTITQLNGFLTYMDEYLPTPPDRQMIYTGYYFWKDWGSKNAEWAQHPLWIARYKADAPLVPPPWTTWTFWQFADTGDGKKLGCESNAVDLDYFNGSEKDFADYFNGSENPDKIGRLLAADALRLKDNALTDHVLRLEDEKPELF